jgi:hypothetical protein
MNLYQKLKNSPILLGLILSTIFSVYIFFIAYNPKFPLLNFNEEFLLIINFFLLIFFLTNAAGDVIGNFLHARHLLVKDEAYKLLNLYKDSAKKLRVSYTSRTDLEDLIYVSFVSVYKPYVVLRKNVEPFLLEAVLNRWTLLQLSLIYREEVNAVRANYLRKFNLLKTVLATNLDKELKSDNLTNDTQVVDNVLSRIK